MNIKKITLAAITAVAMVLGAFDAQAQQYTCSPEYMGFGIPICPESRCSPYDRSDYRYIPAVEDAVVRRYKGHIYGPYENRFFTSTSETDIEHIVSLSEAHDSGLCLKPKHERMRFANDPMNITLASPAVNRHQKGDKDMAEWVPNHNKCWFLKKVIQVKQEYGLTVDWDEVGAMERVAGECITLFNLQVNRRWEEHERMASQQSMTGMQMLEQFALRDYDTDGNGKISCAEARARGHEGPIYAPGFPYKYMNDRNNDGKVC